MAFLHARFYPADPDEANISTHEFRAALRDYADPDGATTTQEIVNYWNLYTAQEQADLQVIIDRIDGGTKLIDKFLEIDRVYAVLTLGAEGLRYTGISAWMTRLNMAQV